MSVYTRGRVFVLQRMFVFGYNGDGYMDGTLQEVVALSLTVTSSGDR